MDQVEDLAEPVVSTAVEAVKEVSKNSDVDWGLTAAFYAVVVSASAVLGAVGWTRIKKWNKARQLKKEVTESPVAEKTEK